MNRNKNDNERDNDRSREQKEPQRDENLRSAAPRNADLNRAGRSESGENAGGRDPRQSRQDRVGGGTQQGGDLQQSFEQAGPRGNPSSMSGSGERSGQRHPSQVNTSGRNQDQEREISTSGREGSTGSSGSSGSSSTRRSDRSDEDKQGGNPNQGRETRGSR